MTHARAYITGFILSIALTLAAPGLLWLHAYNNHRMPSHETLAILFVVLALVQLWVQLVFFLHVGREKKPRWNLLALGFGVVVVVIVVGGTLWIMYNLSHMQQHPAEPNMFKEENIFPDAKNN